MIHYTNYKDMLTKNYKEIVQHKTGRVKIQTLGLMTTDWRLGRQFYSDYTIPSRKKLLYKTRLKNVKTAHIPFEYFLLFKN